MVSDSFGSEYHMPLHVTGIFSEPAKNGRAFLLVSCVRGLDPLGVASMRKFFWRHQKSNDRTSWQPSVKSRHLHDCMVKVDPDISRTGCLIR